MTTRNKPTPAPPEAPPAVPAPPPDTFFDLSFRGGLPEILRALAARLEARDCAADSFQWSLNAERLQFTASIWMKP